MGAGKGTLFFDIINTIKKLSKTNQLAENFLQNSQFHIIEISENLTKIQKEKLQNYKIIWHKNFNDFLQQNKNEIYFISNELFDCFAIDQYYKTDIGWCERIIKNNEIILNNFNPKTNNIINEIINFEEESKAKYIPFSAIYEYSEDLIYFFKKLANSLKKFGGIAVNFDYGYVENNYANSLQAVKNHKKVNIFTQNCDISSQVNFKLLCQTAKSQNLNYSIITQKDFLISLGIEKRKEILISQNQQKKLEIESEINRLINPKEMGELFKCLILWP
jgi:SAM-dependent MidA family methyltransferase